MALRGASIEVRAGTVRRIGRLLSVERQERRSDGVSSAVDMLNLVSDAGDIHTIALEEGVTVRIVEADLNAEVGKYLTIVGSSRDQDVRRLTMSAAGEGERDLFVSYVSEVPVWKSTYRLVLGEGTAAPLLQGWAIVDNTIGEDWNAVELSLVAGAPQAFIQRISQPYYVERPVVPLPERVLSAPQTHGGSLVTAGASAITGRVTDSSGGIIPGAAIRILRQGSVVATGVSDGNGQYRIANVAPGSYDVVVSLAGFRTVTQSGVRVAAGMEPALSHVLEVGAMTESVTVSAATPAEPTAPPPSRPRLAGGGRGGRAGAGPSMADRVRQAQSALEADATGADLGDLFEYKLAAPVTIRKNQSAMVPIVSGSVGAERVSIWTAGTSGLRPLRAIWLTNSTGQTLDGGSVSIVEGQAFAGEGLIDPLKAGERRLLSYATDLAMQVTSTGDTRPSRVTRVQITRGTVIQHREDRQQRIYTARNEDAQPRVLVIEHPIRDGWAVSGGVKPDESTPTAHRFRLTVAPRTTATVTIDEVRPGDVRYGITSVTEQQVQLWVSGEAITPDMATALREVVRRQGAIADLVAQIGAREQELAAIGRDQERVRENMKALKGTSEERQLVQRYVRQLDEQETRLDVLRREIRTLTSERDAAQADLNQFIATLGG
jgi:hypothetical protein